MSFVDQQGAIQDVINQSTMNKADKKIFSTRLNYLTAMLPTGKSNQVRRIQRISAPMAPLFRTADEDADAQCGIRFGTMVQRQGKVKNGRVKIKLLEISLQSPACGGRQALGRGDTEGWVAAQHIFNGFTPPSTNRIWGRSIKVQSNRSAARVHLAQGGNSESSSDEECTFSKEVEIELQDAFEMPGYYVGRTAENKSLSCGLTQVGYYVKDDWNLVK